MDKDLSNPFFDTKLLQQDGIKLLSMISDIYLNFQNVGVTPSVQPGFLREKIEKQPPQKGIDFQKIFQETKDKIVPGMKFWSHP